jgi:hypothetical protein
MSGISPHQKKDSQKKEREEQGFKSKIGETSFEMLHVSKKERMRFISYWERFCQKKE